jgi:fumarate hydratase subunit beta
MIKINEPFIKEKFSILKAGDIISLTGKLIVMRDAAHKKIYDLIVKNEPLPFDFQNQLIYYMGPCPKANGQVIGSCGPTTSKRMDFYTPALYEKGIIGTIGKGSRNEQVLSSIINNKGVYLSAVGGAGAYYSKCVKSVREIAYSELLSEAIIEISVVDFQCIVAIDSNGKCL